MRAPPTSTATAYSLMVVRLVGARERGGKGIFRGAAARPRPSAAPPWMVAYVASRTSQDQTRGCRHSCQKSCWPGAEIKLKFGSLELVVSAVDEWPGTIAPCSTEPLKMRRVSISSNVK